MARPVSGIEQSLAPQLLLQLALGGDVEHVPLQVERRTVVVEHDTAVVANPDDAAVPCDQAILEAQGLVRAMGACVRGEHPVAVVGMKRANEEVRIVPPLLDGVAEQRLDLAAREDVRAGFVQRVDVDHEGQLFDERAVAPLDLPSFAVNRRSGAVPVDAAVHQTEIGRNALPALTPKGDPIAESSICAEGRTDSRERHPAFARPDRERAP